MSLQLLYANKIRRADYLPYLLAFPALSAGSSVLQKGHTFCLIPPIAAIFFLQFGHSIGFDAPAGLKHISKLPPFFVTGDSTQPVYYYSNIFYFMFTITAKIVPNNY